MGKRQLIHRIQTFRNHTEEPLTLANFLKIYNLRLGHIYKNHTFSSLKAEALEEKLDPHNSDLYRSMLSKKWIVTESLSYFTFILNFIKVGFDFSNIPNSEENRIFSLMLYYDFYQEANQGEDLYEALKAIGENPTMVDEMKEFIEYKIDQIGFEEIPFISDQASFSLQIHSRYTREQVLVALQLSDYKKQSSNREGVALNKKSNMEALFVNLQKSEEDFSPTTMYDDYAINEYLFHWQSQNQTSSDSPKGQSYINHKKLKKTILLFVRESKNDEDEFTQGYVFLGPVEFISFKGSKPMSIKWKLEEPIPNYIWKESAKLQTG